MSDLKTLRLASIQLTEDLLSRFVMYQRKLLTALGQSPPAEAWAGRVAFAHGEGLRASGLDPLSHQKVKVLVAEFCGRRSVLERVRQRVAQASRRRAAGESTVRDEAIASRAAEEVPRLEDLGGLADRYGPEAVALLCARQEELIELHERLVRLEGAGGHLHPSTAEPRANPLAGH